MYFLCRLKATHYSPLLCQFSIAFCWLFFLCFFFLPKVVFEGSSHGFYGKQFLVAVNNVVFLIDECGERPSPCESLERAKTTHCSQRILRTRFQSILLCYVTRQKRTVIGHILMITFKKYPDKETRLQLLPVLETIGHNQCTSDISD